MGRLDKLDLDASIEKADYKSQLKELQLQILHHQLELLESKKNIILVFEGPDAAGKGGVIKRFTENLDPRRLRVWSIVKPTPEEYAHHYLWRFWNKLPPQGEISVFDRSWYGRVLVERVEGFASETEWKRAFEEINNFEQVLADGGSVVLKFWLMVDKDEQLRRFEKRAEDPNKRWKINDEDWRNREKWDQHVEAAEEMFERTDKDWAPWHLIEGNFKWFARIKTLKIIEKAMREALS